MDRADAVLEAKEGDGVTKAEAAPLVSVGPKTEEATRDSTMRTTFMLDNANWTLVEGLMKKDQLLHDSVNRVRGTNCVE